MKKFTPGAESGTYDSFIEIAYQKIIDAQLAAGKIPSDKVGTDDAGKPTVTEPLIAAGTFPNDNDIVKRVEGSKNGLGFFGYAYFQANKGELKEIAIEDPETGKCVKPTAKTIKDGTYPISRTLYVYPNNAKVADNDTLKAFLAYYLTKKSLTKNVSRRATSRWRPPTSSRAIDTWKQPPARRRAPPLERRGRPVPHSPRDWPPSRPSDHLSDAPRGASKMANVTTAGAAPIDLSGSPRRLRRERATGGCSSPPGCRRCSSASRSSPRCVGDSITFLTNIDLSSLWTSPHRWAPRVGHFDLLTRLHGLAARDRCRDDRGDPARARRRVLPRRVREAARRAVCSSPCSRCSPASRAS